MADIFKGNSGAEIKYSITATVNSLTGMVIKDNVPGRTIDITTIQNKYANRFFHQPPYSGN